MKKLFWALLPVAGAIAIYLNIPVNTSPGAEELAKDLEKDGPTIKHSVEWFKEVRGDFSIEDHYAALAEIKQNHRRSARKSGGLQWQELGPDNVGGRTRAVMVYHQNTKVIFAGGVSGGLYRSDNRGDDWVKIPLLDITCTDVEIQSIGSIAQAPNGDIWVGTGESIATGYPGNGLYKSTDGGYTFCNVASTTVGNANPNTTWSFVNKIAIDPLDSDKIFAGTRSGIRISYDGGGTWVNASGVPAAQGNDMEISSDGQTVFSVVGQTLYRTQDGGSTWSKINGTGGFPNGGYGRLIISLAPTDDQYVYAIMSTGSGLFGVYQSRDQGDNWDLIGPGGTSTFNPPGQQGWYDLEIAAMPHYPGRCFVGGQINVWSWSSSLGWTDLTDGGNRYVHPDHHAITFDPNDPNIMYIGTDGGIFRSYDATAKYPTFKEVNKNYITTQFYDIDASEATGEVIGGTQDNGTINIQYDRNTLQTGRRVLGGDGFSSSISRLDPQVMFAGSQFGALRRSLNGGDGFGSMFDSNIDDDGDGDPDDGAGFYSTHDIWEGIDDSILETRIYASLGLRDSVVIDTVLMDTTTYEVAYVVYDTITKMNREANRLFMATSGGVWMADDAVNAPNPVWYKVANIPGGGSPREFAFSKDGNHAFVGIGGNLYRISGLRNAIFGYYFNCTIDTANVVDCTFQRAAAGISRTTAYTGSGITGVSVDQNNPDHVVISHGSYNNSNTVRESWNATSGSPTWTVINGSGSSRLPNVPAYSVIIDAKNPNIVYVGTEYGVFVKWGAPNVWTQEIDGMEQVQVLDLRQRKHPEGLKASDGTDSFAVYAGTYGRGIFSAGFVPKKPVTGIAGGSDRILDEVVLFPNPATNYVNMRLTLGGSETVVSEIYDITGKRVNVEQHGTIAGGMHTLRLNTGMLQGGMYLVKVTTGGSTLTGRFIIGK